MTTRNDSYSSGFFVWSVYEIYSSSGLIQFLPPVLTRHKIYSNARDGIKRDLKHDMNAYVQLLLHSYCNHRMRLLLQGGRTG